MTANPLVSVMTEAATPPPLPLLLLLRGKDSYCPASSSWQGFFLFEGGDGRAGAAEVDFEGPVPGDGFVRANGVVFDAVVLGSLDECEGVGDVAWEQALVFQCPEPAFA